MESGNVATAVSSLLWALNYTEQTPAAAVAAAVAAAAAPPPYTVQQYDLPPQLQQHISQAPTHLRALLWHTALHALLYTAFPGASLPLTSAASADRLPGCELSRWRLDPTVPELCAPVRKLLNDTALLSTVRAVFAAAVRELSTQQLPAISTTSTDVTAAATETGEIGSSSSSNIDSSNVSDSGYYSSECELLCLNWQQLEQCAAVLKGDTPNTALVPLLHALGTLQDTAVSTNGSASSNGNSSAAPEVAAVAALVSASKHMAELLRLSLQCCTGEYSSAVAAALAAALQEQQQCDVQLLACLLAAESGRSNTAPTAAVATSEAGTALLKQYWPSMEHVWEGLHRYYTISAHY
jgi:hypothetical protein